MFDTLCNTNWQTWAISKLNYPVEKLRHTQKSGVLISEIYIYQYTYAVAYGYARISKNN